MRRADLPVANHVPHDPTDENDDFMQGILLSTARCSWEELKEKRYVEFERELPAPWIDTHFARIGGWQLMPPDIVAQWDRFCTEDEANLGKPWPLVFTSRRQRRKFNGQLDFLGEICDCLINPATAAEHGIADGDRVRVSNKSGEIVVTARVDPDTMPGVCSIPHGHYDANINNLTSTHDMDPLGGMAHYSAVPIAIERVVEMVSEPAE
jgi:anaerobic selenocysteine-containing dehydrogenase